jgi:O-antigen/teichoic acid export membrane protein
VTLSPIKSIGAAPARLVLFFQSSLVRSIGVLVGGTAAAHVITALAMPISTHLFTPEDFSAAATFASLVAILVAASCLRFDMAIPLPEEEGDAANLLALSVFGALVTASLLSLIIWLTPLSSIERVRDAAMAPYLPLVPLAVLLGGSYLALQMWFVRMKGFGAIARNRILQSITAAGGQIGMGAAGFGPIGLIVGQMLNYGVGTAGLGARVVSRDRAILAQVSPRRMIATFRAYSRFPRYSIWEALANAASTNVPILLIAALTLGPEPGYLVLANFLLLAPMSLLGSAVSQVYLSRASEELREGRISTYTADIIGGLLWTVSGPMAFLAVVSPAAFGLVFGDEWTRSGVLVSWMVPWFLMQFLSSPVSSALHVTGNQRVAMLLQIIGLVLRVGAVLAAGILVNPYVSEVYALSSFAFYGLYLVVVLRSVGLGILDLRTSLLKAVIPTILGAVAGLLAIPAIHWVEAKFLG